MKKPLVLPEFKNEDEEIDFWDKIDITEYFEPSDLKKVEFPNLQPSKNLTSVKFPKNIIAKAKTKAKKLNIPYEKLMWDVLQQGISAIKV